MFEIVWWYDCVYGNIHGSNEIGALLLALTTSVTLSKPSKLHSATK